MVLLDDIKKIKKIDRFNVLGSVEQFPLQLNQSQKELSFLELPESYKKVKNIVVAGMGGSSLGAQVLYSLGFNLLKVPLLIVNDYHLPSWTDKQSLVIVSSYSGNTEETLSCCQDGLEKKLKLFILTTGGKLAEIARKNKIPSYIFKPEFNPADQPRLGVGYSIMAQLVLLSKCNLMKISLNQVKNSISYLEGGKQFLTIDRPLEENLVKKLAIALKDKMIILVSAYHLVGAAYAVKNMFNESSKTLSFNFPIPEMNHHLLEGLTNPKENKNLVKFLFFESKLYEDKIKKRFEITKEVVSKNRIDYESITLKGKDVLTQALETVYSGGFLSYYLAILYGVDPAAIPWVDYFKKRLRG